MKSALKQKKAAGERSPSSPSKVAFGAMDRIPTIRTRSTPKIVPPVGWADELATAGQRLDEESKSDNLSRKTRSEPPPGSAARLGSASGTGVAMQGRPELEMKSERLLGSSADSGPKAAQLAPTWPSSSTPSGISSKAPPSVTVEFQLPNGTRRLINLKSQPIGIEFDEKQSPAMVVKRAKYCGPAGKLGVRERWQVVGVNGQDVSNKDLEKGFALLQAGCRQLPFEEEWYC